MPKGEYFAVGSQYYDEDGNPITQDEWTTLFQASRWQLITEGDGVHISTVYIGLNHEFDPDKSPLIFESQVQVDDAEQEMVRYATKADAIVGHSNLWYKHRKKREWIISDRITSIG